MPWSRPRIGRVEDALLGFGRSDELTHLREEIVGELIELVVGRVDSAERCPCRRELSESLRAAVFHGQVKFRPEAGRPMRNRRTNNVSGREISPAQAQMQPSVRGRHIPANSSTANDALHESCGPPHIDATLLKPPDRTAARVEKIRDVEPFTGEPDLARRHWTPRAG